MPKELKEEFAYLKNRTDVLECCKTGIKLTVEETGPKIYKARCGVCGRGHIKLIAEPWTVGLSRNDLKRASYPHVKGDGGPPMGRIIVLPNEIKHG